VIEIICILQGSVRGSHLRCCGTFNDHCSASFPRSLGLPCRPRSTLYVGDVVEDLRRELMTVGGRLHIL